MKKKIIAYSLIAIILGVSCSGMKNNKDIKPFDAKPFIGKLTNRIYCQKDSTLSYALYLPSNYDSTKRFPLIFFFDSHGGGNLPLNMYKDLAEKYKYILVGTYNSQNGQQLDDINISINKTFEDVYSKLAIDKKRVYTAGFSGGSRVALTIAQSRNDVSGVIACSAGVNSMTLKNKLSIICFTGNTDFNYVEMNMLDKYLGNNGFKHHLEIFNGKHEWPSIDKIEDAFVWFEIIGNKNESLLNNFINSNQARIDELKKKNNTYEVYCNLNKLIDFVGDTEESASYLSEFKKYESTTDVQKILKHKIDLQTEEISKCLDFSNNYMPKDAKWWTDKIKSIIAKTKTGDIETQLMNKRLLANLSISSYSYCSSMLASNQFADVEKFLKIYQLSDPTNSYTSFFYSCYYAKNNLPEKSLESLENAAKLGFFEIDKIKNDMSFDAVRQLKRYNEVIEMINANKKKKIAN